MTGSGWNPTHVWIVIGFTTILFVNIVFFMCSPFLSNNLTHNNTLRAHVCVVPFLFNSVWYVFYVFCLTCYTSIYKLHMICSTHTIHSKHWGYKILKPQRDDPQELSSRSVSSSTRGRAKCHEPSCSFWDTGTTGTHHDPQLLKDHNFWPIPGTPVNIKAPATHWNLGHVWTCCT